MDINEAFMAFKEWFGNENGLNSMDVLTDEQKTIFDIQGLSFTAGYKEGGVDTLDKILAKVRRMKKHGAIDVYPESIYALEAVEVFLLEEKLFPEEIDTELNKGE